ncbi:MAG: exodeoxyribonuclease VII large subunit [Oscillospiraceae bacterium]|nr:exodeoxyribonuclease VII large subunit [Oscillospiraceae bacterium]
MSEKIFSISEINNYVKRLLDNDEILVGVGVKGELSNYKTYPSGHHYFTMKDAESSLKCVMFKGSAVKLRFRPESGMSVVAFGRISVYPRDGAYQLYVNDIKPDGVGDLYVAFEQLKEKLQKEGLFDEAHKKRLPRFPKKIAIITSPVGAVIDDMTRILGIRWPMTEIVLIPVRVQGAEAPPEIVQAIAEANKLGDIDLIITGRGGGSIEDLWSFNDERVARAIFASNVPVISAVGHEPDVTIADFVADVRASTPSNAAEIAVPDSTNVLSWLSDAQNRSIAAFSGELKNKQQKLTELSNKRVMQKPTGYVEERRIHIDRSYEKLVAVIERKLHKSKENYTRLAATLDAMSPLKVLGRGYSIAQNADGNIIKTKADVKTGDKIKVKLKKDEINAVVE